MGVEKRLDRQCEQMTLYTVQTDQVLQTLRQDGFYYVKRAYVSQKYEESASAFLNAYRWYAKQASQIVARPPEAESAVWAFCRAEYLECHPGSHLLTLNVPLAECVFFRMQDWNQILNLRYLGRNEEEKQAFEKKLERQGVPYEGDVYTTPFYPLLQRELLESWRNLFRYDAQVKKTGNPLFADMQVGLWLLDQNWLG